MTDKREVKQTQTIDRPTHEDPKLQTEVIADLDVPNEDAEALQGGLTSGKPSCAQV